MGNTTENIMIRPDWEMFPQQSVILVTLNNLIWKTKTKLN